MDTDLFDYELPKERIAQEPAKSRDASRLMIVDEGIAHGRFSDISHILQDSDLLLLNDTKVVKASFKAKKDTGGKVTGLVLSQSEGSWTVQMGGKNLRPGVEVTFPSKARFSIVEDLGEGVYKVVPHDISERDFYRVHGRMPLPPYIKAFHGDEDRYQTVYAKKAGAVAAPTAGLHFTPDLLEELVEKGVKILKLTLKVGPGTFAPVRSQEVEGHAMEEEFFQIPAKTRKSVEKAVGEGRRIFAVGTTTVRALESSWSGTRFEKSEGMADLFIYPGYDFRFPYSGLVTNFHLPRSTLLMMISAYAGRKRVLASYEEAKEKGYRFYSFGDAMLLNFSPKKEGKDVL